MKIQLDYKIDIDIQEGNKSKEKLTVFYREFTKAEKKETEGLQKQFTKIYKKLNKIGAKQNGLTKKAELHELNGDYEKALKAITERDSFEDELDELSEEIEQIGGEDNAAFVEKMAEDRFDKLLSGKGKEKLREYAEIKGYQAIMQSLDIAKAELEKKPSGE